MIWEKNGFPHRIVDVWNKIPVCVLNIPETSDPANKVAIFESRLDRLLANQEMVYDYKAKIDLYNISIDTGRVNRQVESNLDLVKQAI